MMACTPHQILGVPAEATLKEAKAAFRRLALEHHPDKGGSAEAFSEISQALEDIKNPAEHRARIEREEYARKTREAPETGRTWDTSERHHGPQRGWRRGYGRWANNGQRDAQADDKAWERRKRRGVKSRVREAPSVPEPVAVSFVEAARGKTLLVSRGRITVPAGTHHGETFVVDGRSYVASVQSHPTITRSGNDMHSECLRAVAGQKVLVDTVLGPRMVAVPRKALAGDRLRIRDHGVAGHGLPTGHHYVHLLSVAEPVDSTLWDELKANCDV